MRTFLEKLLIKNIAMTKLLLSRNLHVRISVRNYISDEQKLHMGRKTSVGRDSFATVLPNGARRSCSKECAVHHGGEGKKFVRAKYD